MSDSKQVRLNELARELEIKAKVLIDYLPEIGVKEKKTHSSSIDIEHAELARKHFLGLAAAEAAAEAAKTAAAKAKTARPAPAPAAAPAAKPAGPAAVPPRTAPPTPGMPLRSTTAPPAPTASPAGAPLRPAAAPMAPAAAPGHPTTHPTTAARPGVAPATTAPRPGVPQAQRPAAASPGALQQDLQVHPDRQARRQRLRDFQLVRDNPANIRRDPALHKECAPLPHRDKFVRAVRRVPAVLREDFRSDREVVPDRPSRSAASGPAQQAEFPRLNRENLSTRGSPRRHAGVRQSKNATRKANAGFIRYARAPERLRAAPLTWNRSLRFSASRAR